MEIINYKGKALNILGSVDEPYFIGSEVGRILGYTDPKKAISDHVSKDNKFSYPTTFFHIAFCILLCI